MAETNTQIFKKFFADCNPPVATPELAKFIKATTPEERLVLATQAATIMAANS